MPGTSDKNMEVLIHVTEEAKSLVLVDGYYETDNSYTGCDADNSPPSSAEVKNE
jgi:hypothetical protein